MDKICDKKSCCGCRACENICPQNAIIMKEDEKGFLYPFIDQELCIDCQICQTVCPALKIDNKINPIKIYACKNKNLDKRLTSSSGGTFTELSKLTFKEDGVVYGAIFDDDNKVVHAKATDEKELEKIKRSKYVQSDMKDIFKDVKEEMKQGKKILFSGTPCQVQAVNKMFSQNLDKLLLVDVVCHGVPSPKVFEDYKKYLENKYNSKITNVNFRHKTDKTTQNIKVDFENGESYISSELDGDVFYLLFLTNIVLRDVCYNCNYKCFERVSDISLADFWGYAKGDAKEFGDNKGVSLVLINTQKGMEAFERIKENLDYMEIKKEDCVPYNCFSNFEIPSKYDEVWQEYLENGLESLINKKYNFRD